MDMYYFVTTSHPDINQLIDNLRMRVFNIITVDSVFEFRKALKKEIPELVFVTDTLKEKTIPDLMQAIKSSEGMWAVPIIGLVTSDNTDENVLNFLRHGATDVIRSPFNIEEVVLRSTLRKEESEFKQNLTSVEFFFNEAQEKEQGRRSGIFHFYDEKHKEVGEIYIKDGRVVFATYGSLIKEDAFLQLACNTRLFFNFEDREDVGTESINEGITNLLLEASKLKDEIKKQEGGEEERKALVIDENRVARVMASRALQQAGFTCKVTSPQEMSVRFMANFSPNVLVIDYESAPAMLDKLWPTPRTDSDIPVIIYCDDDIKDINFDKINNHQISASIYKNRFITDIDGLLRRLKILPQEE